MARNTGINNNNLKTRNRGLILKLIATKQCTTRIELAKVSGLTKMSVSYIISEFIEQGLVKEIAVETKTNVGRNPILLDISPSAPKVIGVFISRENCSVVLCDFKLNILEQNTVSITHCNSETLIHSICELIDKMMEHTKNILGIGIGSIGPVDIEKGVILNPPNFYGITDLPIVSILKEHYELPVFLDNQYNCAALAEKYYGIGKDYHDFIFLGITHGIGSGIILNDQLMKNANGLASEIGHISIDFQGNPCDCGNRGCLETYAGTNIICRRLEKAVGIKGTFKEFCQMYENPIVNEILIDMIEKLTCGLTSSINILNPQAIIIGDEGIYLPDQYLKYLEKNINRFKMSKSHRYIDVIRPYFKENSHLIGSAVWILHQMFRGRILF